MNTENVVIGKLIRKKVPIAANGAYLYLRFIIIMNLPKHAVILATKFI